VLDALLPAGVARFRSWKQRFEDLGYSGPSAARAASSREHKRAYADSRIVNFPSDLRRELGCVVDVGANRGQWASALLTLRPPRRFEIFEPNPEAFAILERSMSTAAGVRLHRSAIGAEPGELVLHVTEGSEFASFLEPERALEAFYAPGVMQVTADVRVPVETLDRVLHDVDRIDLLKIDVQGFERQVLSGAADVLRRTRALLIEANFVSHYKGDDTFGSLTALLRGSGFELWDLAPPFHAPDGRALWCDAVFANPQLAPSVSRP
jgi:FkbM family methyltransferase